MGATLLIVDVDSGFREHLARHFKGAKWRVLFAGGFAEARKRATRRNIDIVLLVLNSLKNEGLEILRMIKSVRNQTEVIILGGADQIALSIEGMKLGAFDDFMGPFDIDTLIGRTEDAWIQKRQREEKKKSLLHQSMDAFSPGAFAEDGEPDGALAFMKKDTENSSENKNMEQKNGKDKSTLGG